VINLIERLRKEYVYCIGPNCENWKLMAEAADEIERLEKKVTYLNHAHDACNTMLHVHGWDWDQWRAQEGYIDYEGNRKEDF